jgi:hypothetical protein
MLRTVREAMAAKKWVRKTINDHVARILRAFAWAVTEGMIPAPVHGRSRSSARAPPAAATTCRRGGRRAPSRPPEARPSRLEGRPPPPRPQAPRRTHRHDPLAPPDRDEAGRVRSLRADQIDRTSSPSGVTPVVLFPGRGARPVTPQYTPSRPPWPTSSRMELAAGGQRG